MKPITAVEKSSHAKTEKNVRENSLREKMRDQKKRSNEDTVSGSTGMRQDRSTGLTRRDGKEDE